MPSWNEKPVTVPTVNVNLKPCDTPHLCAANSGEHVSVCAAHPNLIPLSLEPFRSVTFTVRLGECAPDCSGATDFGIARHLVSCPARPIRVSCSISGKTWEESEVMDVEEAHADHRITTPWTALEPQLLAACRERWALVKALVLGFTRVTLGGISRQQADAIFAQRDAVYAALADMWRHEEALWCAVGALPDWVSSAVAHGVGDVRMHAEVALSRYVDRLIEQVGAL